MKYLYNLFILLDLIPYPWPGPDQSTPVPDIPLPAGTAWDSVLPNVLAVLGVVLPVCIGIIGLAVLRKRKGQEHVNKSYEEAENKPGGKGR